MSALAIAGISFLFMFGAALLGFWLRGRLPEHHLTDDSKTVVQLGTGLVATLAALVLGMLTASAKAKFDVQTDEVQQVGANIVLLDRALARYGPDAQSSRALLKVGIAGVIAHWGRGSPLQAGTPPMVETIQQQIRDLPAASDGQKALQSRALDLTYSIANTRWLALEQSGSSVSYPLLVVMVTWLTAIFLSFGLMARPNATLVAVLVVSALSVSTAIFLIFELDQPFGGLISVSSEPLRVALAQLGM